MNYPHWNYYQSILNDLENISRYIEISEDNYDTYSIELTKLFLSICSEIDVVAKLLCSEIKPKSFPEKISQYRKIICEKYPEFTSIEIIIGKNSISIKPWSEWDVEISPEWWQHYNKVKHVRNEYFTYASLKNVLFSAAGLCVMICYLYKDKGFLERAWIWPLFMFLAPKYRKGHRALMTMNYRLPDINESV